MNVFKRLKNVFSPMAQSYDILEEKYNFKFIEKFYKTPFYSFSVYLTILISSTATFITYFSMSQSKEVLALFMLFSFFYNLASFLSIITLGQFFLKKISKKILFKFTKKYDILVNIDKERKKHFLNQEELKRFVKKFIVHNDEKKASFALFLSDKKYKAISKYDVIDFLKRKAPSSLNDAFEETRTLYECQSQSFPIRKSYRERKMEKGLEIIEHLASDKKVLLDKDNNIILEKEYNKKQVEVK